MKVILILLLFCQATFAQVNTIQLLGIDESHLVEQDNYKLTQQTAKAFAAMQAAALDDGIAIQLVSAHRSFERQQEIWERKFKQYTADGMTGKQAITKILEYSTIPGTSRHHWGTDIDITDANAPKQNSLLVTEKFDDNGPFAPLHKWMQANAHRFGFVLVYTNDEKRTGFAYEPWHYSYFPEAKSCLTAYSPREAFAFFKSVGVKGSNYVTRDFWDSYYTRFVKGINPVLIDN
mgnify:CR=1 FL=1